MRSEASVFPHIGAIFLLLAPCVHPCLCAEGAALAFLQGPGCETEPGESTLFRALLGSWGIAPPPSSLHTLQPLASVAPGRAAGAHGSTRLGGGALAHPGLCTLASSLGFSP